MSYYNADIEEPIKIHKKSCLSSKFTLCIGRREFIDYLTESECIDGIVEVDPDLVKKDRVLACLTAEFRYGRDDSKTLGMNFRKEILRECLQVYPPLTEKQRKTVPQPFHQQPPENTKLTLFQEKMMKKLGSNAIPFTLQIPRDSPSSVSLQNMPGEPGKPCGVDFELKVYVCDENGKMSKDDTEKKRDQVMMVIKKLTYGPYLPSCSEAPSSEIVKEFKLSSGRVRLEVNLNKEIIFHGDEITVNVSITNTTNKTVRRLKLLVIQMSEIMMFSKAAYYRTVAELESEDGFPLQSGQVGFCKSYRLQPNLNQNRDKQSLAMDGQIKFEDTCLASSTVVSNPDTKENLGVVVSYFVRTKLGFGIGTSDLQLDTPFTLTHACKKQGVLSRLNQRQNLKNKGGSDVKHIQSFPNESYSRLHEEEMLFEDFANISRGDPLRSK